MGTLLITSILSSPGNLETVLKSWFSFTTNGVPTNLARLKFTPSFWCPRSFGARTVQDVRFGAQIRTIDFRSDHGDHLEVRPFKAKIGRSDGQKKTRRARSALSTVKHYASNTYQRFLHKHPHLRGHGGSWLSGRIFLDALLGPKSGRRSQQDRRHLAVGAHLGRRRCQTSFRIDQV